MKIQVTQEDIDKGLCRSPAHCPVAIAIRRETGNSATVYAPVVFINGLDVVELPDDASAFVNKFDRGLELVEPFEFELDIG